MAKVPQPDQIPQELKVLQQWVIWRNEIRGNSEKPTKVPYQGRQPEYKASASNPATWCTIEEALLAAALGDFDGIGFVFTPEDPYVGIDLDQKSAVDAVLPAFNSYTEVSFSGRGVHIICRGDLKRTFNNHEQGVECYDQGRYFVFTGDTMDSPKPILEEQAALDALVERYATKSDVEASLDGLGAGNFDDSPINQEKYRNYLSNRPPAIEGIGGDHHTYVTACKGKDLGLSPPTILNILQEEDGWNTTCIPSWDHEELVTKVRSAFDNGQNAPGCAHPAVIGTAFGDVDEGSAAPAFQSSILPEQPDLSNVTPLRIPGDGSTDLRALEERLGAIAPSDLAAIGEVLREAVYLPDSLHQERIVTILAGEPFGLIKSVARRNLKDYRDEAMQLLPARGIAWANTTEDGIPLPTFENLEQILRHEGIEVSWNEMSHTLEYDTGATGSKILRVDERKVDENTGFAYLKNICNRIMFPVNSLTENIFVAATRRSYHPFEEYLDSDKWDGISRIKRLVNTLTVPPEQKKICHTFILRWALSVVACVRGYGKHPPKGVLTFAGPQNIGKTSWLRAVVPPGMFGEGMHLDPNNKDSKMMATKYLVVELGELDATFRRADLASLKAHLSNPDDEYRRPYARATSKFKRQTVYAGTVNQRSFLQDDTGNVRFWPVDVMGVDLDTIQTMAKSGEIHQFWLELDALYNKGERWYLMPAEVADMIDHIDEFREVSPLEERMEDEYDWEALPEHWRSLTISAIRLELGMDERDRRASAMIKQCLEKFGGAVLPQPWNGRQTKVHGKNTRVFKIPPKKHGAPGAASVASWMDIEN